MNDLRSPLDDRPYRPADRNTRMTDEDDVMTTAEYYRSHLDAIRQSRWFPLASVCAAVLIFSGIVSYAYKQGAQTGVNATTPVVEATDTAFKEKPANPGGMDVPFQDAIVFDQLQAQDSANAGETIESLLPPPEQPVETELAQKNQPAATNAETASQNAVEAIISEPQASQAVLKQEAPATESKTVSDIPTVTAEKAEQAKKAAEQQMAQKKAQQAEQHVAQQVAKKMDQVAPAAPSPAATAISSGSYRVQLGAFRDEASARAAWNTFQKQYAPQLNNVTPDFPRADLGAKGIFYRVHGRNLSKASADSICKAINAQRSGSCMVTQ